MDHSTGGERHQMEASGHPPAGHQDMMADYRRRFILSMILTLPILLLSPAGSAFPGIGSAASLPGADYLLLILATILYIYGGYPFLKGFAKDMAERRPGMNTLVATAISTAYVYSTAVVFGLPGMLFFWELATLVDIMLLGHCYEMKSAAGASRALKELAALMPADAHLLDENDHIRDVPIADLHPGDRVLVRPGEKIPADGTILTGKSSINEAMLTGESLPISRAPEDSVIGGSINAEGSLTIRIDKTGEASYIAQVIRLVEEAQRSKSAARNLADHAAVWLTLTALAGGALTLAVWTLIVGSDFPFALERTVTVMVTACPHALGLAVPLVVAVSTSIAAGKGLLICNRTAFERARHIQAVLFDKTGTLTEGSFGVTDIIPLAGEEDSEELLALAASVESRSEHHIARGITAAAERSYPVESFRALPGKGVAGRVEGRFIEVIGPGYMEEKGLRIPEERIQMVATQGKTIVFLLIDGEPAAALALADSIRPESSEAVAQLRARGIRCIMLTGDNRQTAAWVAEQTGVDEFFAEVLPDKKALQVEEIRSRGLLTAMVGDGINDAPALAAADVGIAIGAGTNVAIETADIVLVRSNPLDTVAVIDMSKAVYRKMVENLIWATGYNIVALPLAAGVLYGLGILLSPAAGAVLMSVSTLIVTINAARLRAVI